MSKESFKAHKFYVPTRRILDEMERLLEDYGARGFRVTGRQLFYRLVASGVVENTQSQYDKVLRILGNARRCGRIDWDVVEDRIRTTRANPHWESPRDILRASAEQFRFDKWKEQSCYVEVMIEKQALDGVIHPVCAELDVTFTSNRGYDSLTAKYEAGKRFEAARLIGKSLKLLYLGDHDPSGKDMDANLLKDVTIFSRGSLDFERIALTLDQIEEWELPSALPKKNDTRHKRYVAEHGNRCWELDALPTDVLQTLVRDAILALRDEAPWEAACEREETVKAALAELAESYHG